MLTSLVTEIIDLERHLQDLAARFDEQLAVRYRMNRPPMPPGLYRRLRWLAGLILRSLGVPKLWRRHRWPVSLKQSPTDATAKPILIWALGADRDSVRKACASLSGQWDTFTGFAPVLITDLADFAFYSRLGWLVEFVPRLVGQGEPYEERKLRYLARLYNGAPVLPISVGLDQEIFPSQIIARTLRRYSS
jgi:hypothetical protein